MPVVLAFFYSMTNVAGTVTFARASDDYFFMLDSAGGPWRVTMQKRVDVSAGDAVEVNGTGRHCGQQSQLVQALPAQAPDTVVNKPSHYQMLIQIIPAPALDPNLQVLPTETPTITQLEKPSLLCPFGVPKSTESINVIKKVFYASTFWT